MSFEAKNFDALLGTPGFSDTMLKNHFTLYQGYVKNTNAILEKLDGTPVATPEATELQRRFGWEFNGMRLHELYFGNMVSGGTAMEDGSLKRNIEQSFGSIDSWKEQFVAVGAMRGIGWAVLYYDRHADRLLNVWINEHDVGHLAGCVPVLVMDVFEHAYMTDYGIKRADYLSAFMNAIDWSIVEKRLEE